MHVGALGAVVRLRMGDPRLGGQDFVSGPGLQSRGGKLGGRHSASSAARSVGSTLPVPFLSPLGAWSTRARDDPAHVGERPRHPCQNVSLRAVARLSADAPPGGRRRPLAAYLAALERDRKSISIAAQEVAAVHAFIACTLERREHSNIIKGAA